MIRFSGRNLQTDGKTRSLPEMKSTASQMDSVLEAENHTHHHNNGGIVLSHAELLAYHPMVKKPRPQAKVDVLEESTMHNIHMPPLPENKEKIAAIAAPDATAGAESSSSEPSLIKMHNNNSHEDGDETLADHRWKKRGAGSSAEGSEGSGTKKAKVIEELPSPVPLPTDQSERQGIGMGIDRPTTLAGHDRLTGLGGLSLAYQAATGLNVDIGFTPNLMLRDELVAAAERFAKVTFEAAMKAFHEEADQLRKERDDAQAAASEERRLREVLAMEKVALEKVLLAKSVEAQELAWRVSKLSDEVKVRGASALVLKKEKVTAELSRDKLIKAKESLELELVKAKKSTLATITKNKVLNIEWDVARNLVPTLVQRVLAVVRSSHSTDLNVAWDVAQDMVPEAVQLTFAEVRSSTAKIIKGHEVAGDPHRQELEEIAESAGSATANLLT